MSKLVFHSMFRIFGLIEFLVIAYLGVFMLIWGGSFFVQAVLVQPIAEISVLLLFPSVLVLVGGAVLVLYLRRNFLNYVELLTNFENSSWRKELEPQPGECSHKDAWATILWKTPAAASVFIGLLMVLTIFAIVWVYLGYVFLAGQQLESEPNTMRDLVFDVAVFSVLFLGFRFMRGHFGGFWSRFAKQPSATQIAKRLALLVRSS